MDDRIIKYRALEKVLKRCVFERDNRRRALDYLLSGNDFISFFESLNTNVENAAHSKRISPVQLIKESSPLYTLVDDELVPYFVKFFVSVYIKRKGLRLLDFDDGITKDSRELTEFLNA